MKKLMRLFAREKLFFGILFTGCLLIFLAHYFAAGQAVYGDGIGYFAYLHSIYFDHDIDFRNEYVHIYNYEHNNSYYEMPQELSKKLYIQQNTHTLGMALLLLPFYIIADIIVLVLNYAGFSVVRNGYSDIYQIAVGIGSIVYLMIGLKITQVLISNILVSNKIKFINKTFIRFVIITIFLSSPLIYYGAVDVVNSHAVSFFSIGVFFLVLFTPLPNAQSVSPDWIGVRSRVTGFTKFANPVKKYILLGFIAGVSTMVRLQEVVLFLPLFCKLIEECCQLPSGKNRTVFIKNLLFYGLLSGLVFLITIAPMLVVWEYLFGTIFRQGYAESFYHIDLKTFSFMDYFGSLIDPANGLFLRTPLLLILFFSVPFIFKYFRKEAYIFLSYFIVQFFIITFYHGWSAAAYGGRMYTSSILLFFLIATKFFDIIRKRYSYNLLAVICAFFILLNIVSIFSFMVFEKNNTSNRTGIEKDTKIRIEKIVKAIKSYRVKFQPLELLMK